MSNYPVWVVRMLVYPIQRHQELAPRALRHEMLINRLPVISRDISHPDVTRPAGAVPAHLTLRELTPVITPVILHIA